MGDSYTRAVADGTWHPPMALIPQIDAFAYALRQQGLTYRAIGERMDNARERVRQRIARHEVRMRREGNDATSSRA